MQIGPQTLARALEVRNRIDTLTAELQRHDNESNVDSDNRAGEVVISSDQMKARGASPLQVPVKGGWASLEEIQHAHVAFDPAGVKPASADIATTQFYNSSYGRSAEDRLQYSLSHETDRAGRPILVYQQTRNVVYNDANTRETIKIDAATGNVLSYQGREYAQTFGQGVKEMLTTIPGIGLTVTAGLLFGCPGTLGYALAGPIAGVVAAGAVVAGLAYMKTRPSSHSLPQHNA